MLILSKCNHIKTGFSAGGKWCQVMISIEETVKKHNQLGHKVTKNLLVFRNAEVENNL